jgi:hypothetical protein
MKIVQTLWTLPSFLQSSGENLENRLSGGWRFPKYYYFAMAYSCLSLKKFYNEVELVADDFGSDLLINKLKLPYTSVKTLPKYFDNIPVGLWALPKIYSYSIQDKPFLHVDNDIFIWDKLPNDNKGLLVQNFEKITGVYNFAIETIKKNCINCPDFLDGLDENLFQSINAGVFGGNDTNFIKYYTDFVFNFVNQNLKNLSFKDSGVTNVIIEQLFFYQLAQKGNKQIYTVTNKETDFIANFVKFEQVPFSNKYIHCLGGTKKNSKICKQIELRLCEEFPDAYDRIIKYLKLNSIANSKSFFNYKKANQLFIDCEKRDEILNIPLTLSPNITINQKNDEFYLIEGKKKYRLKNWNKILLFFYGKYQTISEVLINFTNSEVGKNFAYEDTKENIISVITYHSLYYNRFIR